MTKAKTPFKMFYVELPEAKPFSAKRVRCYVDLETGDIYGSKEVVSRFLKSKYETHSSVRVVQEHAQGLMDYYWNKDNKGIAPVAGIRGKVVKRLNPNSTSVDAKLCGKDSKLEFVLL